MGCRPSKTTGVHPPSSSDRTSTGHINQGVLARAEEKERRRAVHDLRNIMNNFSMLFEIIKDEAPDNPGVDYWCNLGEKVITKLAVLGHHITGHNFESPMQSTERLCLKISKPDQRVLIVEDDSVTADLLTYHCSINHIPSHRVRDGAEALRYLLEGTPLWDAVRASGGAPALSEANLEMILSRANVLFLDLFLPRVNGLTLLAEMDTLGILSHFDVVAMSGRELTEDEMRMLYSYTPNLLVKPFNQGQTTILFD